MNKKKSDSLQSLTLLFCICLTYILFYTAFYFSDIKFNQYYLFLIIVPTVLLGKFLVVFRKNIYLYIGIVATAIITGFVLYKTGVHFLSHMYDFFVWISENPFSKGSNSKGFLITLIISSGIIISVIELAVLKKYIVRLVVGSIITVLWILMAVFDKDISRTAIICASFIIATELIELFVNKADKSGTQKHRAKLTQNLVIVIVIFSVLVSVMPSKDSPIQWTAVKSAYNKVIIAVSDITEGIKISFGGNDSLFSLSMAGFSGDGEIGGDLSEGADRTAIKVVTSSRLYNPVYLTGSVKNHYENNHWTNDCDNDDSIFNDKDELEYALNRCSSSVDRTDIVDREELNVIYDNIKTRTIFYPLKSYQFDCDKKFGYDCADVSFKRSQRQGSSYTVLYRSVNYMSEEFLKFISSEAGYQYNCGMKSDEYDSKKEAEFEKYKGSIYEDYLNIPDTVTQRVKDLSFSLTEGCTNSYYKLKAIEEYLNENYTYTLTPGKVPEGQDVSDYFLFDSKEGYCTYYATSMAVLGRCAGIPTRFVEGFVCSPAYPGGYSHEVTDSCAHAWVEGYIDGIGWIPFEPTAPYAEKRYSDIKPISSGTGVTSQYKPDEPEMDENIQSENIKSTETETKSHFNLVLIIIALFLVSAVIIVIISYFIFIWKYNKKYKLYNLNAKYIYRFKFMLYFVGILGYKLGEGETLLQLEKRLDLDIDIKHSDIKKTFICFMKMRYGTYQVSQEEVVSLEKISKSITEEVKKVKGKFRYRIIEIKAIKNCHS